MVRSKSPGSGNAPAAPYKAKTAPTAKAAVPAKRAASAKMQPKLSPAIAPVATNPVAANPVAKSRAVDAPVKRALLDSAAPVAMPAPEFEAVPAAETLPEPAPASEPAIEAVTPAAEAAAPINDTTSELPAIPQTKDPIMATQPIDYTSHMNDSMADAATEVQTRFQQAFEKSSSMLAEMTDLAKGNVEAVVESGKLLAAGMQDMGKTYADEAKSAYETVTADMKEMAAIKSPTELFQLQGKIMRRNFDALVAATTKNTDAAIKLANEAIAPISGRVTVTTEKLSQVA